MNSRIKPLVSNDDIVSGMLSYWRIVSILERLDAVVQGGVEGDIVELGCNIGTLGMYIRKYLDANNVNKTYHVYDSWLGLPEPTEEDQHNFDRKFKRGSCSTTIDKFLDTFNSRNLQVPVIHSGWFKDIPDSEFPDKIAFAFFDGDFYESITDSFEKVYHKVQPKGCIMIDDCGWDILPGVKRACEDFLSDKPEKLSLSGYRDELTGEYRSTGNGGIIFKQ